MTSAAIAEISAAFNFGVHPESDTAAVVNFGDLLECLVTLVLFEHGGPLVGGMFWNDEDIQQNSCTIFYTNILENTVWRKCVMD